MRLARFRISPLYLIVALILGAALALGRYSYRNARLLADQSASSLAESNRILGEQFRERVDNFIIDSDRSLLDIVDLEHLQDFARRWTEIVRLSQPVEAAIVLDEQKQIVNGGYVSKRRGDDAENFRQLFTAKILPKLELDHLKLDLHKHLHVVVDGRDYLISYMKREQRPTPSRPGRVYYVALKISLDYLVREFFPEAFETLKGRELYAVVDDHDRVVFGDWVRAPRSLLYEEHFPTTLYLWRLQMAPPEAARLSHEASARRASDSTLVALMVLTILVGIAFLVYAVDKEARANTLKSEFISNVSHELKTPLSLIRMFGELLALGKIKSPEQGREYAEIITRESERLSRLIDNVLDFSRIERGKASYEFQAGALSDVVARATDVYKLRFEREGVSLRSEIDPDLPDTLFDESAMTLVLLNLLDNAVKYGAEPAPADAVAVAAGVASIAPPAPKIRVEVGLRRDADRLLLTVRDHGPGIRRDDQRRIFDRFYRAPSVRAQNARGSGIGLSLVKHIAEAHGGKVGVESEVGKGATFFVTIPIVSPERGPEDSRAHEEAA